MCPSILKNIIFWEINFTSRIQMTTKRAMNIYLLLWCIFNVTFSAGIMISRPIYVILFVMTIYYGIQSLKIPYSPPFIKALLVLTSMFLIYGSISILKGEKFIIEAAEKNIDSTIYLISISISILPIYAFYYLSYRGILTKKQINKWVPIFLLSCIATFYFSLRMLVDMGRNEDTLVINGGYSFVSVIPLLFFIDNRKLRWAYLTVIIIFTLLSVKRGAILIAFCSSAYFILQEVRNVPKRKKLIIGIATFMFALVLSLIIYHIYSSNPFIQLRLQSMLEGNTSHRDVIYDNIINHWLNKEDILQQIFGLGASATLTIGDNYAHNDWLEILINNGVLGIIIFVFYWISTLRQTLSFPRKTAFRNAFVLLFFIGITQTMFSMYYNDILTPMAVCMGYCSGISNRIKSNNKKVPTEIE